EQRGCTEAQEEKEAGKRRESPLPKHSPGGCARRPPPGVRTRQPAAPSLPRLQPGNKVDEKQRAEGAAGRRSGLSARAAWGRRRRSPRGGSSSWKAWPNAVDVSSARLERRLRRPDFAAPAPEPVLRRQRRCPSASPGAPGGGASPGEEGAVLRAEEREAGKKEWYTESEDVFLLLCEGEDNHGCLLTTSPVLAVYRETYILDWVCVFLDNHSGK
ncbi:hypothetical protein EI555_004638, partial [Monodon monoceros]